jgi:sRNA-binding protein
MGVARQVGAAMSWSLPYTLGVLGRWKMAAVYCQAVLCYDQRIALDGSPAETVDAEAKNLATKQLAQLAARKAAKKAAEDAAPAFGDRQGPQCLESEGRPDTSQVLNPPRKRGKSMGERWSTGCC